MNIDKWIDMSNRLKQLKLDEMALRKQICMEILADEVPPCKRKVVIGEHTVRAEITTTDKLDVVAINGMWKELTLEEKAAVKFTPSLVAKEYKKLDKTSILHSAVETRPDAPTLKIL